MTKDEFLLTPRSTNVDYVAEQVLSNFSDEEIKSLKERSTSLFNILIKSWAKEMPFNEIVSAIEMAEEIVSDTEYNLAQEHSKMHPLAENALQILRTLSDAENRIEQIKTAFDLLAQIQDDSNYTDELESLIEAARGDLAPEIEKELTVAIYNNDFTAYKRACNLFFGYNEGYVIAAHEKLWNTADGIFLISAKITITLYTDSNNVLYEKAFDDKLEGSKAFTAISTAMNTYPSFTLDDIHNWPPDGSERPNFVWTLLFLDQEHNAFAKEVRFSATLPISIADY